MGMRTWVWETGGWPLGQGLVQTFCSWVIVTRAVWCKISASGHVFFIGQILPREKNDEAISGHVNTFSRQTSFHHLSPLSPHWSSHTALRFLRLTHIAHISLTAADDTSLTLTPPAGPGGDLSSVWQESNRYRVTAGGQHSTWAMSCRERPGKWELWAAPAQTQDNGQTNNQSRKCHTIFVISDYSLDIVDSALLIRGRLPSEGESPAPAAVPRGVRGKPARAARNVAEIKES